MAAVLEQCVCCPPLVKGMGTTIDPTKGWTAPRYQGTARGPEVDVGVVARGRKYVFVAADFKSPRGYQTNHGGGWPGEWDEGATGCPIPSDSCSTYQAERQ